MSRMGIKKVYFDWLLCFFVYLFIFKINKNIYPLKFQQTKIFIPTEISQKSGNRSMTGKIQQQMKLKEKKEKEKKKTRFGGSSPKSW